MHACIHAGLVPCISAHMSFNIISIVLIVGGFSAEGYSQACKSCLFSPFIVIHTLFNCYILLLFFFDFFSKKLGQMRPSHQVITCLIHKTVSATTHSSIITSFLEVFHSLTLTSLTIYRQHPFHNLRSYKHVS